MHPEPLAGPPPRTLDPGRAVFSALRSRWRRHRHNPVTHNSAYVIGSQLSLALMQGLQFFLLARALGAAEFGRIASVVAIASALLPFSGLGLGNMAILRIARGQAAPQASLGNALAMTTVTAAAGVALAVAIAWAFLPQPGTWLLMLLIGVSEILLTKCIDVAAHVFYGLEKHRFSVLFYNLHVVTRLACAAALWAGAFHPTALAWAQLHLASGLFTAAVVLSISIAQLGRPRTRWATAVADARTGFFFSLSLASRSMQLDADKSILARSVSSAAAGIYTAAFRLVFMACMPIFAIVVAIQARMFRRGREEGLAGTLKAVRPLMAYAAGYCVLLALAIYLLAPVVPSLLGASYEGSVEVVRLLCLLPFFLTIQSITAEALTGADSQRLLGALYALAAAMALVLNLVLVPRFGWSGAVMAAYGSQAFLLAGMFATILVLLRPRRIASESRP